ncbi:MAG: hypothetical protein A2X45_21925 [Lentisphaerae bacterium GWF2_50_93]|nr:MAG: hypothetical protein A2X45_21925 [Lentisphaerae bacterium GWF2_50_93]
MTRYCLSFNTSGNSAVNASWELQILNNEGLLPYEGSFKADWQRIVPERKTYTHSFLTHRDGVLLRVILESQGAMPEITDMKLEEITGTNPVINGDFSSGPLNYSGWTDRRLAKLETNENGETILKCEPEGYALTDPIPVEPGSIYRYAEGSHVGGQVLVYDYDLLRIGRIDGYLPRKNPFLKIPADAAFIRIEYCDGRPTRVPVVNLVGLELVEKGTSPKIPDFPAYPGEIILEANSPPPEVRAAREIQHWVRKISGKEMRVLAVPSNRDNMKIRIGGKLAKNLFPEDFKYLDGSDGFAVRQKDKNIYIFGSRPSGALFGAFRFLEKNTDIIWARPRKEFGTVFTPNPSLEFKEANFILRPAFVKRMSGGNYAKTDDSGIWQGRLGLNTSAFWVNQYEREEMGGAPSFDGNFMSVIAQSDKYKFEKCKTEHPEFFIFQNGKRDISPNGYICYTAPGIAEAISEGLCEVIKKAEARGEKLEHISVRTRDGWAVCTCPECMKPIKLADGSFLEPKADTSQKDPLFFSTRVAVMMNKVAAEFAKTYPNMPIGVSAYIYMAVPPAVKHAPSLIPLFCAYGVCSIRFPILEGKNNHCIYGDSGGPVWETRFREYLNRNASEDRKLSMFAYYYCNGFSTVADSAAADWSAMVKSGGVYGVHMDGFSAESEQGLSVWDYRAIEWWIMARLMWEPTLDPQKLREDYIKRAYGRAAPEMLEFYNIIRKVWGDPDIKFGATCHSSSAEIFETLIVKTGNEEKLRSILVEAEKKVVNPNSKILVQRTLTAFDSLSKSLNRLAIPYVQESTAEWNIANSTFWMQAFKLGEFKKVSTWSDFKQAPAKHQTNVSVMRDETYLYFHFQALDAGKNDRVELVLTAERRAPIYFFALDRNGKRYDMKNYLPWDCPEWKGEVKNEKDSYTAMFKIPLSVIRELDLKEDDVKLYAKFSRLAFDGKDKEESTLDGTSITRTHYMNYWKMLTIAKGNE